MSDRIRELRHNLRTPINHILGYCEMLLEDAQEAGREECVENLTKIHAGGKQALSLINRQLSPETTHMGQLDFDCLRRDLAEPLDLILAAGGVLEGQGEVNAADLAKIRSAAERLSSLVEEAVAFEAGPASEPDRTDRETRSAPPPRPNGSGRLLVVDDNDANRDMLRRRLEREGYSVSSAEDGRRALEALRREPADLVLLDIMMPEIDGYEVLRQMKADPELRDIPVIMISALDEVQSVVRCIEMGAEDYLPKPFDPVLLRARIGASLEKKRLRDKEQSLMLNILPASIAEELRTKGSVEPKYFEDVTIVFTDFVGFTLSTEKLAAEDLVWQLDRYFTIFDRIVVRYGLEKLKTIGDSYMFAGGLPQRSPSHPVDAVLAALEMAEQVSRLSGPEGIEPWKIRVGVHTGPVIAGVVGIRKFAFDVWGDTVNYSSRMESSGAANRVNLSERTYSRVKDFFACEPRGKVLTKDKRELDMFFVQGIVPSLLAGAGEGIPPAFLRRYRVYFQKNPPAFPEFLLPAPESASATSDGM
ncbi:MAG: adenylate/guanylate cyclase domain-containing protein [Bryobacteraceae bacterium]